eukprot:MONOS_7815.1-p1 / transcript=MONOS_7815.1 / gene=MONOS_7815 / organism=Monocercomonoides_exilis_PA203 / gene_product=unspecified product / transcript_product=unspecified product / location=Mono_scaffold00277:54302-54508(+) / protein_length=69 / sequence_SO=supercontig / SO=protein_coding / is_pseudo=false
MGGMEVLRMEGGGGEYSGARVCAGAAEPAAEDVKRVCYCACLPLRMARMRINERGIAHAQEEGNARAC